ncbi:MAG: transglutaminase domain-containing protein [Micropruina sp.]|uniref:transglutaminase domain-containing protein n=1 Tax=Micropruina sp. TaxID=2737536 RepID=UPI0039E2FFFC
MEIDQGRHGSSLLVPRPEAERVQGCCRDQTLLAVGVLRQHGIPARGRVGFADYLRPGLRIDHVVAEAWMDGRWIRFDPGLAEPRGRVANPRDIVIGEESPFLTAAAAWSDYRQHGRSIDDLGVRIGPVDFTGPLFVLSYLIRDVAHRFGDELLLWDSWGAMPFPGGQVDLDLGDVLAELVQRADRGDGDAESALQELYEQDARIRVGDEVVQFSPRGEPPVRVTLAAPSR